MSIVNVLHGTWVPNSTNFFNEGEFCFWVEVKLQSRGFSDSDSLFSLPSSDLPNFLNQWIPRWVSGSETFSSRYFLLPQKQASGSSSSTGDQLYSLNLKSIDCWIAATGSYSRIDALSISALGRLISNWVKVALADPEHLAIGQDLLFWHAYVSWMSQVVLQDQYVPGLQAQAGPDLHFDLYPDWKIVSKDFEIGLGSWAARMPLIATSGFRQSLTSTFLPWEPRPLLEQFSQVFVTNFVTHLPLSFALSQQIQGTLVADCYELADLATSRENLRRYHTWLAWYRRLRQVEIPLNFHLCFQLQKSNDFCWILEIQVASFVDPSYRRPLSEYWQSSLSQRSDWPAQFGSDFEVRILAALCSAADLYPKLWEAIDTQQPQQIFLNSQESDEFLKETAWVLEAAHYKVVVPAQLAPQSHKRAQLRLHASQRTQPGQAPLGQGYLSSQLLIDYSYQLSIGDEVIDRKQWAEMLQSKTKLIQYRGEWIYLDSQQRQRMSKLLHQDEQKPVEFTQLLSVFGTSAATDMIIDPDLLSMCERLNQPSLLEVEPDPQLLQGQLRSYQQRGLAWLKYLESLGLNGCLADDMGLGKTLTVIARLVQERQEHETTPTLLVAPTSVLGNWQKECERFAPHLRVYLHHGSSRIRKRQQFLPILQSYDLIVTSYSLLRNDDVLGATNWHRVVLDEAQNIKNSTTAVAVAAYQLRAQHRLALTGTPVENRLTDLWSIFNFLNPGYLGKKAHFQKHFESAIQRSADSDKIMLLKRLIEPFVLRRLKTDPDVIQDLPEKTEQNLYCNLTEEQASLYQAVVQSVLSQIEDSKGIKRKGLILSTLTKLKQICNHPAQFLQDGSDFTPLRSHKMARVLAMGAEILDSGDSFLVFTQFTYAAIALKAYMKNHSRWNTFYISGSASPKQRQQTMDQFQDPMTPPSVLIVSIRAGGVGINLTKANHVFHFDRWWNPAVENQATDRAFRIGQQKNVFVHKLVAIGTLEEQIDRMIEGKKQLADLVVGSDESWLAKLDNNAFQSLITLSRQAVLG